MDLSPYQYKTPFEAYEFGSYHLKAESKHVCCCMNWLSPLYGVDLELEDTEINKQLNYWLQRIYPLVMSPEHAPISIAISNRVGTERGEITAFCLSYFLGTTFNLCSAILTSNKVGR